MAAGFRSARGRSRRILDHVCSSGRFGRRGTVSSLTRRGPKLRQLETLEPRAMLAGGGLLITEFMASNSNTLTDEDGDSSDWIEIFNPTAGTVTLDGAYLTDDALNLTQWQFPDPTGSDDVVLNAGGYLVVFASGKNRAVAGSELHTNFQLNKNGEYLALVEDDGSTIAHAYTPEFPDQKKDVSYGLDYVGATTPTDVIPVNDPDDDVWITDDDPVSPHNNDYIGVWSSDFGDERYGIVQFDLSGLDLGSPETTLLATGDTWVRESQPNTPYNQDGLSVWNSDSNDGQRRWGIVEFDVSGYSINSLELDLWAQTFGFSDDSVPLKQSSAIIDTGAAITESLTWDAVASLPQTPLETLGKYDIPAANVDPGAPEFKMSSASANDVAAVQAVANGSGKLVILMMADEEGGPNYSATWGDREATYGGQGPQLIVNSSETSAINSASLELFMPATGTGSSLTEPAKQTAFIIDAGATPLTSIDWGLYQSTFDGNETALETLGSYDIGPTSTTPEIQDVYLKSFASVNDIALITAAANSPTGLLTVVFKAVEDATGYKGDWGDQERSTPAKLNLSIGVGALVPDPGTLLFFESPSPGLPNLDGVIDFLADTTFSVDRGFYETSFTTDINSATPGATIVYTLDSTDPTLTNPTAVIVPPPDANTPPTANVLISADTNDGVVTLRAAAFKEGFAPTNIDTQTYIFLDDVIASQTESAGTPAGFPADNAVNGQDMDYGFAADIYNDPTWGPQLRSALEAIPTLSMVTNPDNLFGASTGFYVNAGAANAGGKGWERPVSLELINPDGSPGFQVEAGARIRGNFSSSSSNPKHSFRLFFRNEYGDSKLDFPLFEDEGVNEFEKMDLRTFQNDSWAWQNSDELTMIHDVFSRDSQRDMDQPYTRTRYYHLYVNGQHWGIYQTQERSDANYGASYFGGDKSTYDTIKASGGTGGYTTEATDGDMNGAWRDLWDLVNLIENESNPTANYALYMQAQGLNPNGTRNLAYPVLLDVDNLIDYMNVIFYTNDEDAPLSVPLSNNRPNNWLSVRNQNGDEGFKFFAHDAEQTMLSKHNTQGLTGDRTGPWNNSNKDTFLYSNPQWLHEDLMEGSEEYRVRFGDRVQKHYFNDGALTETSVTARFDARAAEVDGAVVAQSARWGNGSGQNPSFDKNTWLNALNDMRNNYFSASPLTRGDIVLAQLQNDDIFPTFEAASFNQHGGLINAGFGLTMSAPAPTIYYTLDGVTDPRDVGGGINAGALPYSLSVTLNTTTVVKARVWSGSEWSALTEATFLVNPADASNLAITELNYHPYRPLTEISEPNSGTNVDDDFEFIELINTSAQDISLLGVQFTEGVNYTFGDVALTPGQRIVVVNNQSSFEDRYGTGLNLAGEFSSGSLSAGGERIRLADAGDLTIHDFSYDDQGRWSGRPDGKGATLEVIDTSGDYGSPENWQSSNEFLGTPGTAGTGPVFDVIVNEVLSHSDGASLDKVELYNTTGSTIQLDGWHLTETSSNYFLYTFGPSDSIAAGAYLTLTETQLGFALDGQFGDDIWLVQGDPGDSDKPTRFADHHDLDATESNVSLGRVPNGDPTAQGASLFPTTSQSFGSANSPYIVGDVIISEVHYHQIVTGNPDIADDELEYVELYNTTGSTVDISEWELRQNDGGDFEMPAGAQIAASQTVVLVKFDPVVELTKATAFRAVHGIGGGVVLLGDENLNFGNLNNAGEELKLLAPEDPGNPASGFLLVDRVAYDDAAPWPTDADGAGDSLTRTIATNFANFAASWVVASPTPGSIVFPFPIVGDMNGDGLVNLGDVAPIVQALVNRSAFDAAHPTVNADTIGDVDGSGTFDLGDLTAFSDLFTAPATASVSGSASASSSATASASAFATLDSGPAVIGSTMSDATVGFDVNVNDLEALHVADIVFAETGSAELLLVGSRLATDTAPVPAAQTERSNPTGDDTDTMWDDALLDILSEVLD